MNKELDFALSGLWLIFVLGVFDAVEKNILHPVGKEEVRAGS